ncbi:MAG TPA: hypothetical protein VGI40_16790 [Pirellulaceae bacterium]|jgi:hypothetical protein
MYQRLTTTDVTAVERALAAGMRHVDIARELDLSVWTIARIADRRRFQQIDEETASNTNPKRERGANTSPQRERGANTNPKRERGTTTAADLPEDDGPPDYQAQNLHRCPGCGAMIYVTPCIACRMANAVPAAMPLDDGDDEDDNQFRS